ncbi:sortase [Candidatus Roizmanbacteria bacterium]|nr:sortase [Candidatus Roizmanbacteria bacterium]
MSLYRYVKEEKTIRRKVVNYFSYVTLTLGALLLFWAFYPVISFEVYSRFFFQQKLNSPVPNQIASSITLANSVLGTSTELFSNNLRDFTQASLWFPTKTKVSSQRKLDIKEYALSIPKLNIQNAKVIVGGENLTKGLIQYLPTTLPGEYGNAVVFGHSTLPQLYNTKDYKTIFTYLPSLEKGDKVMVRIKDVDYEYEVYEMFVVKPDQISVLEQRYDGPYLTLITCVPPGTYWNRLVVRAKLTKLPAQL